jgi:hypothetical protein
MKQFQTLGISATLIGAVLILAAATAPGLKAEFECKQELMAGAWVGYADKLQLLGLEGSPAEALAGHFSVAGIYVFDEQGRATTAFQTNTTVLFASRDDFLARNRPGGPLEVQFTVNADCTGQFIFTNRASGVPVFELTAVCANGQRECYASWVQSFGNTTPPDFNGIVTLKRVDSPLETKVDALSANINRIMRRLGMIPAVR